MSVNTMSFEQVAAILNDINKGVTGREEQIAPKNTAEFVSVATSVLQAGYDPVMGSISQMVTKTIFSIRPYERHYKELERTRQEWGAITRKLQMIDREAVRSAAYELVDGESIDPFKVNLPKTLQTNFYGFETYQRDDTTTLQQLDNAFMGPEQLGEFMAMKIQNISDQIELRFCLSPYDRMFGFLYRIIMIRYHARPGCLRQVLLVLEFLFIICDLFDLDYKVH